MSPRAKLPAVLPLLLAMVPPLLVALVIARHAENVPFRDQWRFAPDVIDYVSGRYAWTRLWRPSGDHRVVVPRALMVTLAGWTSWDVRAEMWLDFLLAGASVVLLGDLARRTLGRSAPGAWAWTVPISSASVFSMAGWQGWTFGWMMAVYLMVFGATVVAWALAVYAERGGGAGWMLLGSAVAAFSYLSGLTLLLLLPIALALLPREGRRRYVLGATAWAGLLIALYFIDYPQASLRRPVASVQPGAVALFVLRYLGAPLALGDGSAAIVWGAGAVLAVGASTAFLWSDAPRIRDALIPWLLLAAFAAASGFTTAMGRLAAGPGAALLSRYALPPSLLWASVLPCVMLVAAARPWPKWAGISAAALLLALLLAAASGYAATWRHGVAAIQKRQASLRVANHCLHDLSRTSDACLRRICRNNPALVRRTAARLAQLAIGPYRSR